MTATLKQHLPVLLVVGPLLVAYILPVLFRRTRLIRGLTVAIVALGLLGTGYLAIFLLPSVGSSIVYGVGGWSAPWGIELVAGNLGVFFALMVTGVGLPISLYACGALGQEVSPSETRSKFLVLYLLLTGALAGMAFTNDMFNIFVLVEVATLSCCGLVSARRGAKAASAAFNYLVLATIGSSFILAGIGMVYITTGHLNIGFANGELVKAWSTYPHVIWLAVSFFLVGFGVKGALFPLHVWLPDAHSSAPTPASAILSALAVKGYALCLMKILYGVFGASLITTLGVNRILVILGMVGTMAASILALGQEELKRRLAFSTVAQVGYVFLGLGLVNVTGLTGTLYHMASHAMIKSSLFLAAGTIVTTTGKTRISELAGIGKKMPVTMAVFTIASLGLVGIPLFSGFVGKWYLLLGSLEVGGVLAAAVIILGSVLCAAYLFPIIRVAYFEPAPQEDWQDPGVLEKIAMIGLAVGVLVLGTVPGSYLEMAVQAASELLFK
ncbi:MAG: monovalent cation/H+ antiporter subunit D family protein [Firmicutes bacterium]|nr:monovalent cation/H+ antiporter subunit D family protein [Bacillota bacterium]